MEVRHYLGILRRWLWLIVLGALVAGGAAYFVSQNTTPVYRSTARLLIDEAPGSSNGNEYSQLLTEQKLAQTYVELVTTVPVLEETIVTLDLPFTVGRLRQMVGVSAPTDTQILVISVEDTNPQRAADIANTLGSVFITQNQARENLRFAEPIANWEERMAAIGNEIEQLEIRIADAGVPGTSEEIAALSRLEAQRNEAQLRYTEAFNSLNELQRDQAKESSNVVPVEDAQPISVPVRPQTTRAVALAALVGAAIALGLALFIEYLDDTVKTHDQIEQDTKLSTLGMVARFKANHPDESIISYHQPRAPISEAYRVLRTNIGFSAIDNELQSIIVTSASPGEGKSTTAANLAVVMAQAGKRVVLIDADLRRPVQHKIFGLSNNRGMTTALMDQETPAEFHIQNTKIGNLKLMTSGPLPPNPAELLSSRRMQRLQATLSEEADVLIFDTPPVLTVTDAAVLAPQVSGTLFVVEAGKTRRQALTQAVDTVRKANAPIFGTVLNGISASRSGYYYYYYHYYRSYDQSQKKRGKRIGRKRQVSVSG